MATHTPNWKEAAEIVRDAGGRIVGRTKLQKIAYLLELSGLGAGFQFEYRHYGPYSEGLTDAIQMAAAFDLVKEEERRADWGGMYSIYTASESAGKRVQGARAMLAEKAEQMGAIVLELATTAAYLFAAERCADPWQETARLKPEKASGPRLQEAKQAYRQLRKLSVPNPLPDI
jgi:uncharacterized protein